MLSSRAELCLSWTIGLMSTPEPKSQGLQIDSPGTWVGKAPLFFRGK